MKTGDTIKDFSLYDQHYREVRLSDLAGRKVLLSFHPLAWTSLCRLQMRALERNYAVFGGLNTVALGISVDAVPTKAAWAKSIGVRRTRLLSDFWPHGEVAKKYGVFRVPDGFSGRANIVIDEHGRVAAVKKYALDRLPDLKEIVDILKRI